MTTAKILAANWKMAVDRASSKNLIAAIEPLLKNQTSAKVWIAPSFPYLSEVKSLVAGLGSAIRIGAQNACWEPQGAFTGEVSVAMLKECGADFAIIGHSERRSLFLETDEICARRAKGVLAQGMDVIYCVGETLHERQTGVTESVLRQQLRVLFSDLPSDCYSKITIAYEPVWAIGTGLSADQQQITDAHNLISKETSLLCGSSTNIPAILYGGSVNPANWAEILKIKNVAGGLVGGASQKAESLAELTKTLLA